jgi:DNA-3-methyladenine glycosylase
MFGRPGTLYVYFSYGNHWCMNAVCGPGARAHAVLLRAAAPVRGVKLMHERRPKATRVRDLCSGPGRLAQAFGVERAFDGSDLVRGPLRIVDDGVPPPSDPGESARIGLAPGKGDELCLRFYVRGEENVSRPPRT